MVGCNRLFHVSEWQSACLGCPIAFEVPTYMRKAFECILLHYMPGSVPLVAAELGKFRPITDVNNMERRIRREVFREHCPTGDTPHGDVRALLARLRLRKTHRPDCAGKRAVERTIRVDSAILYRIHTVVVRGLCWIKDPSSESDGGGSIPDSLTELSAASN